MQPSAACYSVRPRYWRTTSGSSLLRSGSSRERRSNFACVSASILSAMPSRATRPCSRSSSRQGPTGCGLCPGRTAWIPPARSGSSSRPGRCRLSEPALGGRSEAGGLRRLSRAGGATASPRSEQARYSRGPTRFNARIRCVSHPLVLALFPTASMAAEAAQVLHALGISREHISVVAHDQAEARALADQMDATPGVEVEDSRPAGRLEELAGLVLSAVAVVMPGIGPIVAAGPLAAELAKPRDMRPAVSRQCSRPPAVAAGISPLWPPGALDPISWTRSERADTVSRMPEPKGRRPRGRFDGGVSCPGCPAGAR